MQSHKFSKGYTLPEMLAVVGILLILAAMIVPSFWGTIAGTQQNAATRNAQTLNNAVAKYDAAGGFMTVQVPEQVSKPSNDSQLAEVQVFCLLASNEVLGRTTGGPFVSPYQGPVISRDPNVFRVIWINGVRSTSAANLRTAHTTSTGVRNPTVEQLIRDGQLTGGRFVVVGPGLYGTFGVASNVPGISDITTNGTPCTSSLTVSATPTPTPQPTPTPDPTPAPLSLVIAPSSATVALGATRTHVAVVYGLQSGETITGWTWNFPDSVTKGAQDQPNASSSRITNSTYNEAGTWTISAVAQTSNGRRVSGNATVTVSSAISVEISPDFAVVPVGEQFTNGLRAEVFGLQKGEYPVEWFWVGSQTANPTSDDGSISFAGQGQQTVQPTFTVETSSVPQVPSSFVGVRVTTNLGNVAWGYGGFIVTNNPNLPTYLITVDQDPHRVNSQRVAIAYGQTANLQWGDGESAEISGGQAVRLVADTVLINSSHRSSQDHSYRFVRWRDADGTTISTNPQATITPTQDETYIAEFVQDSRQVSVQVEYYNNGSNGPASLDSLVDPVAALPALTTNSLSVNSGQLGDGSPFVASVSPRPPVEGKGNLLSSLFVPDGSKWVVDRWTVAAASGTPLLTVPAGGPLSWSATIPVGEVSSAITITAIMRLERPALLPVRAFAYQSLTLSPTGNNLGNNFALYAGMGKNTSATSTPWAPGIWSYPQSALGNSWGPLQFVNRSSTLDLYAGDGYEDLDRASTDLASASLNIGSGNASDTALLNSVKQMDVQEPAYRRIIRCVQATNPLAVTGQAISSAVYTLGVAASDSAAAPSAESNRMVDDWAVYSEIRGSRTDLTADINRALKVAVMYRGQGNPAPPALQYQVQRVPSSGPNETTTPSYNNTDGRIPLRLNTQDFSIARVLTQDNNNGSIGHSSVNSNRWYAAVRPQNGFWSGGVMISPGGSSNLVTRFYFEPTYFDSANALTNFSVINPGGNFTDGSNGSGIVLDANSRLKMFQMRTGAGVNPSNRGWKGAVSNVAYDSDSSTDISVVDISGSGGYYRPVANVVSIADRAIWEGDSTSYTVSAANSPDPTSPGTAVEVNWLRGYYTWGTTPINTAVGGGPSQNPQINAIFGAKQDAVGTYVVQWSQPNTGPLAAGINGGRYYYLGVQSSITDNDDFTGTRWSYPVADSIYVGAIGHDMVADINSNGSHSINVPANAEVPFSATLQIAQDAQNKGLRILPESYCGLILEFSEGLVMGDLANSSNAGVVNYLGNGRWRFLGESPLQSITVDGVAIPSARNQTFTVVATPLDRSFNPISAKERTLTITTSNSDVNDVRIVNFTGPAINQSASEQTVNLTLTLRAKVPVNAAVKVHDSASREIASVACNITTGNTDQSFSIPISIPAGLVGNAQGNFDVSAVVDPDMSISDIDRSNNYADLALQLNFPNVVLSLNLGSSASPENSQVISATLANLGSSLPWLGGSVEFELSGAMDQTSTVAMGEIQAGQSARATAKSGTNTLTVPLNGLPVSGLVKVRATLISKAGNKTRQIAQGYIRIGDSLTPIPGSSLPWKLVDDGATLTMQPSGYLPPRHANFDPVRFQRVQRTKYEEVKLNWNKIAKYVSTSDLVDSAGNEGVYGSATRATNSEHKIDTAKGGTNGTIGALIGDPVQTYGAASYIQHGQSSDTDLRGSTYERGWRRKSMQLTTTANPWFWLISEFPGPPTYTKPVGNRFDLFAFISGKWASLTRDAAGGDIQNRPDQNSLSEQYGDGLYWRQTGTTKTKVINRSREGSGLAASVTAEYVQIARETLYYAEPLQSDQMVEQFAALLASRVAGDPLPPKATAASGSSSEAYASVSIPVDGSEIRMKQSNAKVYYFDEERVGQTVAVSYTVEEAIRGYEANDLVQRSFRNTSEHLANGVIQPNGWAVIELPLKTIDGLTSQAARQAFLTAHGLGGWAGILWSKRVLTESIEIE